MIHSIPKAANKSIDEMANICQNRNTTFGERLMNCGFCTTYCQKTPVHIGVLCMARRFLYVRLVRHGMGRTVELSFGSDFSGTADSYV